MDIGETNICSCSAWLSRKPRIVFGFILRWIEEWDTKNRKKKQNAQGIRLSNFVQRSSQIAMRLIRVLFPYNLSIHISLALFVYCSIRASQCISYFIFIEEDFISFGLHNINNIDQVLSGSIVLRSILANRFSPFFLTRNPIKNPVLMLC